MPAPSGTWWPSSWVAPNWTIKTTLGNRILYPTGLDSGGIDRSGTTVEGRFTNPGGAGLVYTFEAIPAAVVEPPEEPEEPPEPTIDPAVVRLLTLLRQPADDVELLAQATEAVTAVRAMTTAYCRGGGGDGIEEVIVSASARLLANPEGIPYDSGSYSIRGAFTGFTLAEQFVLNRWRKRAL